MRRRTLLALPTLILVLAGAAVGQVGRPDPAMLRELAPTGTLRVGLGIAPVGSAFWSTRDGEGRPRGVAVELGAALAATLGLPVEYVPYRSSGEVTEAGAAGGWDVAFLPVDGPRAARLAIGPEYYRFTSTYLVPPAP